MKKNPEPASINIAKYKVLTLILIILVTTLAITAGYYHQLYLLEYKRYKKIEDQFVRVRSQLGTSQTNQLIENSYLEPTPTRTDILLP